MNLEPIIQNEVSQKQNNKYGILMCIHIYIYEIQKNGTDETICRAGIKTQRENRVVDTTGEEEGGTN